MNFFPHTTMHFLLFLTILNTIHMQAWPGTHRDTDSGLNKRLPSSLQQLPRSAWSGKGAGQTQRQKNKLTNQKICTKCLPPGSVVNIQTNLGLTPLHRACILEHTTCAELLVAAGADSTIPDQYGGTPLHYAYFTNNSDLLLLLDNGTHSANKKCAHAKTARVIRAYLDGEIG